MDFEGRLFNLITQHADTGLIFSKRLQLTKFLIEQMNLKILELRESLPRKHE
jgi:hypothetical protein